LLNANRSSVRPPILKDGLEFEQLVPARESTTRSRGAIQLDADLSSTNAQIDAFEAARDAMIDPTERMAFESRILRLNDTKDNLEERKARSGNNALLNNELVEASGYTDQRARGRKCQIETYV
jgi:hypothetical protein